MSKDSKDNKKLKEQLECFAFVLSHIDLEVDIGDILSKKALKRVHDHNLSSDITINPSVNRVELEKFLLEMFYWYLSNRDNERFDKGKLLELDAVIYAKNTYAKKYFDVRVNDKGHEIYFGNYKVITTGGDGSGYKHRMERQGIVRFKGLTEGVDHYPWEERVYENSRTIYSNLNTFYLE